jgi:hypothetical protein
MKRHSFDPISFAAGVVFLMIAGTFAFSPDLDFRLDAWLIPVSFLVLGIGILVASLRGFNRTDEATEEIVVDVSSDLED